MLNGKLLRVQCEHRRKTNARKEERPVPRREHMTVQHCIKCADFVLKTLIGALKRGTNIFAPYFTTRNLSPVVLRLKISKTTLINVSHSGRTIKEMVLLARSVIGYHRAIVVNVLEAN